MKKQLLLIAVLAVLAALVISASAWSQNTQNTPPRGVANPLRGGSMPALETTNPALVRPQTTPAVSQSRPIQQVSETIASPLNELPEPPTTGSLLDSAFGPDLGPLPLPPSTPPDNYFGTPITATASVPAPELPPILVVDPTVPTAPLPVPAATPLILESVREPIRNTVLSANGTQTPQLTITKHYPDEVTLGAVTSLQVVIRNTGATPVRDVVLRDSIPQGVRLVETVPAASNSHSANSNGGELVWSLGDLDAGANAVVEMRVVPTREGEISSVASVTFSADAVGRTIVTRPQLQVDVETPPGILLGEPVSLTFIVSNPGTGTARQVVLENYVPTGLRFDDECGQPLELLRNEIGDIRPQQSVTLSLPPLTCVEAGEVINRLVVRADGGLTAEARTPIRVLAPKLQLAIAGAKTRFLERQAVYKLSVANPGTASAQDVDLVCQLPVGFQFVSTDQSGIYEPTTHTVHWALEELGAGESGDITLTLVPMRIGEQMLRFCGTGRHQVAGEASLATTIDGMAATSFSVQCTSDMVEVGREAMYEIKVTNRGTKPSSGVGVVVQLSKGMELLSAQGPVQYTANHGSVLQFDSLPQLDPKQEQVYHVAAKCLTDGDHRISVRLTADDLQAPLVKEENTRAIGGQ